MKGLTDIASNQASRNLVKALASTRRKRILPHLLPVYTALQSRSQRCFSQFDRKTDCFDGREVAVTDPDSRFAPNSFYPSNLSRVNGKAKALRSSAVWTTFKAVCGTQTRLDGFQVKYQPCSQNFDRSVENKDSTIVEGNYLAVIWQKSRRVPYGLNNDSGGIRHNDQDKGEAKADKTHTRASTAVVSDQAKGPELCLRRIH